LGSNWVQLMSEIGMFDLRAHFAARFIEYPDTILIQRPVQAREAAFLTLPVAEAPLLPQLLDYWPTYNQPWPFGYAVEPAT